MHAEKFPKSVVVLMGVSFLFCLPMIGLSVVNYGMLSIWLNAAVAFFILAHHLAFGIVAWRGRKTRANKTRTLMLVVSDEEASQVIVPAPVAFELWNILSVGFLFIINSIAFGIMVDITTRGPLSTTLIQERVGTHKWNMKIQIGQSAVLGTELLVLGTMLAICWLGRMRVAEREEELQEEIDYGMVESPRKV